MSQVSFSHSVVWFIILDWLILLHIVILSSFVSCGGWVGTLVWYKFAFSTQKSSTGIAWRGKSSCPLEIPSSVNFRLVCLKKKYTDLNPALRRCLTPCLRDQVRCNHFSVLCHHFENEWLKIAPTILDLATVSEGEDVLQLAKRFLTVTIEPPWICVCTHTHLYTKTTHTHTHLSSQLGRPAHRPGQGMQAREWLCFCVSSGPPAQRWGMKEGLLLAFAWVLLIRTGSPDKGLSFMLYPQP